MLWRVRKMRMKCCSEAENVRKESSSHHRQPKEFVVIRHIRHSLSAFKTFSFSATWNVHVICRIRLTLRQRASALKPIDRDIFIKAQTMVIFRNKKSSQHGVSLTLFLIIQAFVINRSSAWYPPQFKVPEVIYESRKNLVSAAVARGTSIAAFFPIDTYKTICQITPNQSLMDIVNDNGLASLYAGLVPALIGQIPYGVLVFGGYEIYKTLLRKQFPALPDLSIFILAAVLGDLTGSGWLCPSEVIKQQSQSGMWPDTSTVDIVQTIVSSKGLGGLYQGYAGNVVRDVPFRVLQLTTYETIKSAYLTKQQNPVEQLELSSLQAAGFGGLAGLTSAAITTPLDVVKTLMMTTETADTASWGGAFQHVYQESGVAGLYAGILPRVELITLMSALFFLVNEFVLEKLNEQEEAAAAET